MCRLWFESSSFELIFVRNYLIVFSVFVVAVVVSLVMHNVVQGFTLYMESAHEKNAIDLKSNVCETRRKR